MRELADPLGKGRFVDPLRAPPRTTRQMQLDAPQTVEELLATPIGEDLRRKFPQLDGQRDRPTLQEVVEAIGWDNIARWQWPTQTRSKLVTYVGKHAAPHRGAWERSGGVDVGALVASTKGVVRGHRPLAEGEIAPGVMADDVDDVPQRRAS